MYTPRVLLVNLPHPRRIQRRYVASYEAPNFLIPPLELMGLYALLQQEECADVRLIDAIAEDLGVVGVRGRLDGWLPDLVIALAGYDILEDDLRCLARLRASLGGPTSVVFGFLPTQRPREVLEHPGVDLVLLGEPEHAIGSLCRIWENGPDPLRLEEKLATIDGIAYSTSTGPAVSPPPSRPIPLDQLPFPDHGAIALERYGESFLTGPIGVIQSARGCPYPCTFCCRAWGEQVRYRSAESLALELQSLYRAGIRRVRFLDDTFTLRRDRVETLCHYIRCSLPELRWSCLTRLDRVDGDLATLMAGSGCDRIYVGIESSTPRRLQAWRKGLTRPEIIRGVAAIRGAGIDCCGFFITGAPHEDVREARRNAAWAAELQLDWVIVTRLQHHHHPDGAVPVIGPLDNGVALERAFYRRFYLRPSWLLRKAPLLLRRPRDVLRGGLELGRYLGGAVRDRDFI
jgi:anaerobic magnesium-protoporphyrin IX monomethyl ester cyclase